MEELGWIAIFSGIFIDLIPVWIALIITFALSIKFKRKLGFYGRLFDNTAGMIGFGIVMFWVFAALFSAPLGGIFHVGTHDAFDQIVSMKNKVPGFAVVGGDPDVYGYYLLGGDSLGRDVYSRAMVGAWTVIQIAPLATLFAFMVGIVLGLPAGYYGNRQIIQKEQRSGILSLFLVGFVGFYVFLVALAIYSNMEWMFGRFGKFWASGWAGVFVAAVFYFLTKTKLNSTVTRWFKLDSLQGRSGGLGFALIAGALVFVLLFIPLIFIVSSIAQAFTFAFMGLLVVFALVLLCSLLGVDTALTFLSNLILAFPVILLFYLLVTPEIVLTGIPTFMAAVLFVFPIVFLVVLFNSRFFTTPMKRNIYVGISVVIGLWLYFSMLSDQDTKFEFLPSFLDVIEPNSGVLTVFVSVVFVNSPTVFRIVRGLTLDIKSRDYVGAAQTRGEGPWYIMLWEILPNVRGPLIVDFCLRIGYVTILLGTLGFFGLGLPPDSPDWGTTINSGRKLLSVFPHPAIVPALCLMSLVLGLNLLADGLREESLKD